MGRFHHLRDGHDLHADCLAFLWAQDRKAAGVERTFHDLRHVADTLNAQAGATLKEATRRLGHSSPDAALGCRHAVDERAAAIADAVGQIIGQSPNGRR